MKKIINFFKYIIKVIFGLFGEFISSIAKVVKKIETKQSRVNNKIRNIHEMKRSILIMFMAIT